MIRWKKLLESVQANGCLAEYGVTYRQVDLKADGSFDLDGIRAAINEKTKTGTHSAFQRLPDQTDLVCDRDRRGDCICQMHQAGCDLYGRQLLW